MIQSSKHQLLKTIFLKTCRKKKNKLRVIFSFLFLSISVFTNILLPISFKKIVDNLNLENSGCISFFLMGYGLLWIISHSCEPLRELFMHRIIERSTRLLNFHIFQQLSFLSQKFYIEQKIGSITNIINRAQKSLPTILWTIMFHVIPVFIEFICVFYILIKSYKSYHVMILFLTIISFITYTLLGTKIILRRREKAIESEKKVDSKIIDWIKNLELVNHFGKSQYVFKNYNDCLKDREKTEISFLNISSIIQLGQTLILGVGLFLMTYFLGQAVINKEITLGDFVLFNAYFIQFIGPISILGYAFKDLQKSLLEIKDVINIIDQVPNNSENESFIKEKKIKIEFKNVSFYYNDKKVFEKLSFVINPGELALIVGATGTGKSTLIKLITRSYKPSEGVIYINDININNICLESLREIMGVMPQDNALIDTTIGNNICFFDSSSSFSKMKKASQRAKIWTYIEKLPNKFNTLVGENGSLFSGGEKQRICLARVFYRYPKLSLFDEPTSAVDEKTANMMYKNIQKHLKKSTKIIITHNINFAHNADKIITLRKPSE